MEPTIEAAVTVTPEMASQVIGIAETVPLLGPFIVGGLGMVVFVIGFGSAIGAARWLMGQFGAW